MKTNIKKMHEWMKRWREENAEVCDYKGDRGEEEDERRHEG